MERERETNKEIAIRVVEGPVLHVSIGSVDVDGHAVSGLGGSCTTHGGQSSDEINLLVSRWQIEGAPTKLVGSGFIVLKAAGNQATLNLGVRGMTHRGTDTVQPAIREEEEGRERKEERKRKRKIQVEKIKKGFSHRSC